MSVGIYMKGKGRMSLIYANNYSNRSVDENCNQNIKMSKLSGNTVTKNCHATVLEPCLR
jgi:hypothetical protein